MMRDDPFEAASGKAAALGACPVDLLDDWYTDHWDFDSLCTGLACPKCVATPEDFGFEVDENGGVTSPQDATPCEGDDRDWEMDF